MKFGVMLWINCVVISAIYLYTIECQLTTDVLWSSCDTIICGTRNLHIQCETDSKILINNVTSGLGHAFDEISYLNLRRMCMGMSSCNPSQTGFCKQHKDAAQFNVSYTCIKEKYIDNTCDKGGKLLPNKSGFITSPNYPAETTMRSCKWKVMVPPNHYVHVFLHEVVPNSPAKCRENGEGGLRFSTINNCENRFPTYSICSESSMDYIISACSTTEIWLPWSGHNMRFWLSYHVVKVPDLRHVSLYNIDITCNVIPKDEFIYRSPDTIIDQSHNNTESFDAVSPNTTTNVNSSMKVSDDGVDYVMYIGLAVGILVIIVIIVIVIIYIRCRYLSAVQSLENKGNLSNSNSQTNCSEIQKRPLPDTQTSLSDAQDAPMLQQSYSSVADEIPRQTSQAGLTPTYAEIEEYSETGMKPKLPLVNKRSVDNSKRKLPAKPDEAQTSIYSEIEDADEKDVETEKSVLSKNKKNQKTIEPDYIYKKKLSNASNIYDECQDVTKLEKDKTYMDMSHKKADDSEYVPHQKFTKDSKDKANLSKKCRVTDKLTGQNILYADCEEKTNGSGKEAGSKLKKESVTSESDSDEDICIVENELYEPFESAKV